MRIIRLWPPGRATSAFSSIFGRRTHQPPREQLLLRFAEYIAREQHNAFSSRSFQLARLIADFRRRTWISPPWCSRFTFLIRARAQGAPFSQRTRASYSFFLRAEMTIFATAVTSTPQHMSILHTRPPCHDIYAAQALMPLAMIFRL